MLPKSIASCRFSGMILESPIIIFKVRKVQFIEGFFSVRKVQFRSLLHILSIYLLKICLVNILL